MDLNTKSENCQKMLGGLGVASHHDNGTKFPRMRKLLRVWLRGPLHENIAKVFGTGVNQINGGSVLSQNTHTLTHYEDLLECDALLVYTRHY